MRNKLLRMMADRLGQLQHKLGFDKDPYLTAVVELAVFATALTSLCAVSPALALILLGLALRAFRHYSNRRRADEDRHTEAQLDRYIRSSLTDNALLKWAVTTWSKRYL